MDRFKRFIQEQVKLRGVDRYNPRGGMIALAREIGVSHTIVKQWLAGADVRVSTLEKVLSHFGGDVERAFPDYKQPNAILRLTGSLYRFATSEWRFCQNPLHKVSKIKH